MIKDLDRVVLTKDIPLERLAAGDVGTVVGVYRGGAAYEVEFFTLAGRTHAVATVEAGALRPVTDKEIVHARAVTAQ